MTHLRILFLSILIGVVFNKTTSYSQDTIAESVIEYCEEHVINFETIRWSGDSIINCLFFNPRINSDLNLDDYKMLNGSDKLIKKLLFFLEMIYQVEFIEYDKTEKNWIINIKFYDKSLISGELLSNLTPRSLLVRHFHEESADLFKNYLFVSQSQDTLRWNLSDIKQVSERIDSMVLIYGFSMYTERLSNIRVYAF